MLTYRHAPFLKQIRHVRVCCGYKQGGFNVLDLVNAWRTSRAVLPGYCHTVSCGLQSCGRWALHPYNAEAAARHADECAARHERLAAAARRQARLRVHGSYNAACLGYFAGGVF